MPDLPSYDFMLAQARAIAAEERPAAASPPRPNLVLRNSAIIGGGAVVLFGYGYSKWWKDGFTGDFRRRSEGAFGRDTEFLGIDKLGHVFTGYFATRSMQRLFTAVGNTPDDALRLAAITTWGAMAAMEVLDGFSRDYRFSHEDLVANTVGVALGYVMEKNPGLDRLVDFRFGYRASPLSSWDPPGDYAGQRFHLALKADGVEALREVPVLKYLELNMSYRGSGVDTPDEYSLHDFAQRRREVFFGVSLDLSRLLADAAYGGRRGSTRVQRAADFAFEFFQPPIVLHRGRDIDR
jgi:hypothetical protein